MRGYCWENRRMTSGRSVNQGSSMEPIRTSPVVASDRNSMSLMLCFNASKTSTLRLRSASPKIVGSTPWAAIDKLHAERVFKIGDHLGNRGVGNTELSGCPGHAAALNNR